MRVLPVIDLKAGKVVRGVGGRRHEYQPIESRLCDAPLPLAVANAFRLAFGLREIYVADLDAIAGAEPAWSIFAELLADGFELFVDAGLNRGTVQRLAEMGVQTIVAGLESISDTAALAEWISSLGPRRLVFSLDMKAGASLAAASWVSCDPFTIACHAERLGVRRMIVLDLTSVGAGDGVSTLRLCRRLVTQFPHLELITGGGVRDRGDLQQLERAGLSYALVASALHDGRLTRADIERVASSDTKRS